MTVESLRLYFSNLAEFVRDVGGQSPAANDLRKVSDSLRPFDALTVESLGALLTHADDYHRTGKIVIDAPITTADDLNAHIKQLDMKLKVAKGRLPEMKRLDRLQTAAKKKADADAKKAAVAAKKKADADAKKVVVKSEPDESSRQAADSIKALTHTLQTTETSDDVIDAEITKLKVLTVDQLRHVAVLINATAGLTARSGPKAIIDRITERLRGVKDSFDRADL